MDKVDFRRLDFSLLLVFSELLKRRKTTIVADKLSLSQSTVSHAVGRLRDIFGEALFIRSGNVGLEPTSRALQVAPVIESLLTLARTLGEDETFNPLTTKSHFRLAGTIYAATLLPPLLSKDLLLSAPNATYSFGLFSKAQSLESLSRNDSDLVIVAGDKVAGFDYAELCTDDAVVVARAGHPQINGALDLPTYLSLQHLNLAPNGDVSGEADLILEEMNQARHVVAGISDFCAALQIVSSSDLVTMLPYRMAALYINTFNLVVAPAPFEQPPRVLRIARHPRSRGDIALDWFVQRLQEITEAMFQK